MVRLGPDTRIGLAMTAAAMLTAPVLLTFLLHPRPDDAVAANWQALQPGQPVMKVAAADLGAAATYQTSLIPLPTCGWFSPASRLPSWGRQPSTASGLPCPREGASSLESVMAPRDNLSAC